MFTHNLKRGFTLIELLVVISIIGVLASVVLASLNTARAKGADAAIKTNLANMRAQAEIIYDGEGCYTGLPGNCAGLVVAVTNCAVGASTPLWHNAQFEEALAAAGKASGGTIAYAVCAQAVNGGAWAISVPLKSASSSSWCVDSTGSSKQRNAGQITTTNC